MATIRFADRSDRSFVENGDTLALVFDDRGLIPVVTTCADTGAVLMQAWMNAEAVQKTIETGEAHYFSRSRQELWHKGATSGEYQEVHAFRTDCDQDALWMIVTQKGGKCCHVGHANCFYRDLPVKSPVDGFVPLTPCRLGQGRRYYMLCEMLTSLCARSVPGARRMGLVQELVAIEARYRRQKTAWAPHLAHTKQVIIEAVTRAPADRPILLLGAGALLDVPLDMLNAHPAGAVLADAVLLPGVRCKLARYDRLDFILMDVTGMLATGQLPDAAPIQTTGFGLVISCNMLSQISLPYASSPPVCVNEREIQAAIQSAHLKALKNRNMPGCVDQ